MARGTEISARLARERRVVRCCPEPQRLSSEPAPMNRNRRDVRYGFWYAAPEAVAPTWSAKFLLRRRKTDSQPVGFSLNGTHLNPAKLHVTHSKDERGSESGFWILKKLLYFEQDGGESGIRIRLKTWFQQHREHGGQRKSDGRQCKQC